MDSIIVLFMREFGWTLEYATEIVMTLEIRKLNALVDELSYQRACDIYQQAEPIAALIATTLNINRGKAGRTFKAKDILGRPPRRAGERSTKMLREAAEEIGIRIPEGGNL